MYILTAVLAVGASLAVALCCGDAKFMQYTGQQLTVGMMLLLTIFSWVPLIVANVLLIPVEKHIQQGFINDAKRILREMPDLKIVGITGSYGKTSTKHYLTRILSEQFETVMTPGSFNTPMGVVRTIREYLKPFHQIFVCEMGAKQKGDIEEICNIVHPDMGIITAVGPMHLETFKNIETVCATKFELADAIPATGFVAINNDFEPCKNRVVSNTKGIRYGVSDTEGCDYRATNVRYTPSGTLHTALGRMQRIRSLGSSSYSTTTRRNRGEHSLRSGIDRAGRASSQYQADTGRTYHHRRRIQLQPVRIEDGSRCTVTIHRRKTHHSNSRHGRARQRAGAFEP
jgi:hypothetical protein